MTIRVNARLRLDPTRTTGTRTTYTRDIIRRFRVVSKLIRKTIVDNNAFGLIRGNPVVFEGQPGRRFNFPTDKAKHDAFMEWLRETTDSEILEVLEYDSRGRIISNGEWQNKYIRRAYQQGIESSTSNLAKVGIADNMPLQAVFNLPVHANTLAALFTRNFALLRGITAQMDQEISRVLLEGFANGLNAHTIAKNINDRVNKIGIVRARRIARTEVIYAHAEATLNRYEQFGVDRVSGLVEFSTANHGVCQKCQSLEGKIYTVKKARGVIPVHPNCRCTWLPVVK